MEDIMQLCISQYIWTSTRIHSAAFASIYVKFMALFMEGRWSLFDRVDGNAPGHDCYINGCNGIRSCPRDLSFGARSDHLEYWQILYLTALNYQRSGSFKYFSENCVFISELMSIFQEYNFFASTALPTAAQIKQRRLLVFGAN